MQLANALHHETQRLAWGAPDAERVEVTFLCADVVGFTEMTERLGDSEALRVMRRVAGMVRGQARRQQGEVLEIRGDAFLLAFASPRGAVRCAIRLTRALALDRNSHAGEQVRLRLAVHTGSVVRDGGGYFGSNLILAYRLLSQVEVGRIAVTPSAIDRLPSRWRARAVRGGRFRPKGFGCEVDYLLFGEPLSDLLEVDTVECAAR